MLTRLLRKNFVSPRYVGAVINSTRRFNSSEVVNSENAFESPFYIPPKYNPPAWPRVVSKSRQMAISSFMNGETNANILWIHGAKDSGKSVLVDAASNHAANDAVLVDLSSRSHDVFDVVVSEFIDEIVKFVVESPNFNTAAIRRAIELSVPAETFEAGLLNHGSSVFDQLIDSNPLHAPLYNYLKSSLHSDQLPNLFDNLVKTDLSLDVGGSLFPLCLAEQAKKTSQLHQNEAFKALDIALSAIWNVDCDFGKTFEGADALPRDMQFAGISTVRFLFALLRTANANSSVPLVIRNPEVLLRNPHCADFGAGLLGSIVVSIEDQTALPDLPKLPVVMDCDDGMAVLRTLLYREEFGTALGETKVTPRCEIPEGAAGSKELLRTKVGFIGLEPWTEDICRKVLVPRFFEWEDHFVAVHAAVGGHVGDLQRASEQVTKDLLAFESKEIAAVQERIRKSKEVSERKGGKAQALTRKTEDFDDDEDSDPYLPADANEEQIYDRLKYLTLEKMCRDAPTTFLAQRTAQFEHALNAAMASELVEAARLAQGTSGEKGIRYTAVLTETFRALADAFDKGGLLFDQAQLEDGKVDHPIVLALLKEGILTVRVEKGGDVVRITPASQLDAHLLRDAAELIFERLDWKERGIYNVRLLMAKNEIRKAAETVSSPWKQL